jgi:hypothetical protein
MLHVVADGAAPDVEQRGTALRAIGRAGVAAAARRGAQPVGCDLRVVHVQALVGG